MKVTTGALTTEKDKFEAVFQHMADGVIVLDEFSRVIDLNSAAEGFVGMEKSALIGEQVLMERKMADGDVPSATRNLQIICQPKFEEGYVRCWDYFSCQKHDCPAYESEELRCWLLPQTQCDHSGNVEENPEVKMKDCLRCLLFVHISEKYRTGKQRGSGARPRCTQERHSNLQESNVRQSESLHGPRHRAPGYYKRQRAR